MPNTIIKVTTGDQRISVIGECIAEIQETEKHTKECFASKMDFRKARKAEQKESKVMRKLQVGTSKQQCEIAVRFGKVQSKPEASTVEQVNPHVVLENSVTSVAVALSKA